MEQHGTHGTAQDPDSSWIEERIRGSAIPVPHTGNLPEFRKLSSAAGAGGTPFVISARRRGAEQRGPGLLSDLDTS